MKPSRSFAAAVSWAAAWVGDGAGGRTAAETLVASLSTARVAITSNYTGASVAVFGMVERDAQTVARPGGYDIVVTVRGPPQPVLVREKEPLGPIWINRGERRFGEVPAYLGVFSSRPLADVTSDALRKRYRLGIDASLGIASESGASFREALIRLRARDDLYVEDAGAIDFLASNLFRTTIPVPPTAPPGNYEVEIALLSDSVLLARAQTRFELVKIGFEERIGELARNWPAAYGGATAALALLFGWLASVIFRRD